MVVPDDELDAVGRDAHAVIEEAKAVGVYVFGGCINEEVPPVLVPSECGVAEGGYPCYELRPLESERGSAYRATNETPVS